MIPQQPQYDERKQAITQKTRKIDYRTKKIMEIFSWRYAPNKCYGISFKLRKENAIDLIGVKYCKITDWPDSGIIEFPIRIVEGDNLN